MNVVNEIMGYEVLATLGFGARSTIFAVKDKHAQVFALKRVIKESAGDQRFLDQAVQEHEIASRFEHPALRKSLKLIRQRALIRTNEIYVLMELVDGLTLEHSKPSDLNSLCSICKQVADGLCHMHQKGFVHADIKPNNILVAGKNAVKIIDFGQSCTTGTIKQRIQGTPDYIAPEQVLRKEITPLTDVFNFGATMYWLLTNHHVPTLIPKGEPGMVLRRSSEGRQTPAEVNPEITPALSQLVMHCLETEPANRPRTMQEVSDRLEIAAAQFERLRSGKTDILLSPGKDGSGAHDIELADDIEIVGDGELI